MSKANSTPPLAASLGLIVAGISIAALSDGGLKGGSILGGFVSGAGFIPGLWAAWAGAQEETQKHLAMAIVLILAALAVAVLLIALDLLS